MYADEEAYFAVGVAGTSCVHVSSGYLVAQRRRVTQDFSSKDHLLKDHHKKKKPRVSTRWVLFSWRCLAHMTV